MKAIITYEINTFGDTDVFESDLPLKFHTSNRNLKFLLDEKNRRIFAEQFVSIDVKPEEKEVIEEFDKMLNLTKYPRVMAERNIIKDDLH